MFRIEDGGVQQRLWPVLRIEAEDDGVVGFASCAVPVVAAAGEDQGGDSSTVAEEEPERRLGPAGENGAAPEGCRFRDRGTVCSW